MHTVRGPYTIRKRKGLLDAKSSDNKRERGFAHICMRGGERTKKTDLQFKAASPLTFLYEKLVVAATSEWKFLF